MKKSASDELNEQTRKRHKNCKHSDVNGPMIVYSSETFRGEEPGSRVLYNSSYEDIMIYSQKSFEIFMLFRHFMQKNLKGSIFIDLLRSGNWFKVFIRNDLQCFEHHQSILFQYYYDSEYYQSLFETRFANTSEKNGWMSFRNCKGCDFIFPRISYD